MSIARNSHSFLYNHKYAIALASLNLGAAVFDHAWAASSGSYSLSWKLAYMVAVPLVRSAIWGVLGHGVDVASKIAEQMVTEESPLIQVQNRL